VRVEDTWVDVGFEAPNGFGARKEARGEEQRGRKGRQRGNAQPLDIGFAQRWTRTFHQVR
jgi:hypothetical protein